MGDLNVYDILTHLREIELRLNEITRWAEKLSDRPDEDKNMASRSIDDSEH